MSNEDTFHLGIKALTTNASGRVLLLKVNPAELKGANNKDYWDLPGGRIHKGGTVEDTLRRELKEEINADQVNNIKPLGMVLSNIRIPVGGDSVGLILGVYTCDLGEDFEIKLSNEHIEYQWADPQDAADLLQVKYPPEFCALVAKL